MLLIIIAGVIYLNHYLENEIVEGLEKEYPASVLSYDEISVNALAGRATIKNLRIKEGSFSLKARELSLNGFSYSDYLKNEDITIGRVHIKDPHIVINKSDSISKDPGRQGDMTGQKFRIKNFTVTGGDLKMIDNDTASNTLYASLQNLRIGEIIFDKKIAGALLPFSYETINIKSDSLYYEMNSTHYIQAKLISFENKDLIVDDFSIIPKYSKEVFDTRIPYEKDWIALKIDRVNFKGLEWLKEEEQAHFIIPSTSIENAHLQIYRNKMLKDDTRIKPMYSEMLRELDFKIQLDSVHVTSSYIEYEENVLEDRSAGELSFHNVNASIKNLTNRNLDSPDFPTTQIEADALFMGEADISLRWQFDVSNKMDEFQVNGRLGAIRADHINPFFIPAMSVEAEGKIESLYYDFYGNRNQANGNMQLSYREFKVNILKDGEQERRSLLSRLANLILKNDMINEDVQQENISVTRDKTKSFWNFLWLCIRDGALSTFF